MKGTKIAGNPAPQSKSGAAPEVGMHRFEHLTAIALEAMMVMWMRHLDRLRFHWKHVLAEAIVGANPIPIGNLPIAAPSSSEVKVDELKESPATMFNAPALRSKSISTRFPSTVSSAGSSFKKLCHSAALFLLRRAHVVWIEVPGALLQQAEAVLKHGPE
jgi:hypothetical protein